MPYAWYKKFTDKIIPEGFIKFIARIGITANTLTLMSMVCTIVAFMLFWQGKVFWGGIFAVLDWAFDYFDGRVARLSGGVTKFGSYFDFVSDRLRMSWVVALAFSGVISFELAITALFVEALEHLVSTYVELKEMRRIPWLINNVHVLTFGAVLNLVELSLFLQIGFGTLLLMIHVVTASYLNFYNKK